ncbi:PREDICTED: syntaxin-7 [Propithecus coquereli]|uniref:syntaxin-7 n=1 Tax=Propithecus coquereli TaxID=379532 RepID=UPI00063F6C39|nr:PREDICTED: syntaxin-7 [Propithecus coquereli]
MSYIPGIGGDPAQLAQRISSNIQKITQCSVEIQRALNQLGTPQDSPELRQQLQQKQQYTNQLAKETDKYIKEFGSLPTTPSEQRQRKIQKDRLVAEFTTSLTNFQKVQRQAAEREKEFVARVRAGSRVSGGFPEESSKERNLVSWESFVCVRVFYLKDSIEANVENAEVHVQQANQQLSRAADYQVEAAFCMSAKLNFFSTKETIGDFSRMSDWNLEPSRCQRIHTNIPRSDVSASPPGLLGRGLSLQLLRGACCFLC